jgi:plastocyanin domain-containing protein
MLRASPLVVALVVALVGAPGLVACSKEDAKAPAKTAAKDSAKDAAKAAAALGTIGPDGVRTIAIEAGMEGYVPDKIAGKPGEKLKLVFTRTVDGECLAELKTPDGALIQLPKGSPVEVAVTVPDSGALTFACGMDMFRGQIVADTQGS